MLASEMTTFEYTSGQLTSTNPAYAYKASNASVYDILVDFLIAVAAHHQAKPGSYLIQRLVSLLSLVICSNLIVIFLTPGTTCIRQMEQLQVRGGSGCCSGC
jgi:hypothetical protein